ncbi:MAG: phosphoribosylaminoimidazolesuccinocarboxamide synthase [Verrucomicrobiales bacterium]
MTLVYEGKAKKLFAMESPDELLMEFKDSATAFNAAKKAEFAEKGRLNKALTLHLYRLLESNAVATHFVRDAGDISIVVKRVEIIPIELVVRNVIAGSLQKRTGLPEGQQLKQPIIELYYKDDALGDPMINDDHVRELGLATPGELTTLRSFGLRINDVLREFFGKAGLNLVDFKIEMGRLGSDRSRIVLADEISPDTCRLWDATTGEKLDKDRFRFDLGDLVTGYTEVLKRVESQLSK